MRLDCFGLLAALTGAVKRKERAIAKEKDARQPIFKNDGVGQSFDRAKEIASLDSGEKETPDSLGSDRAEPISVKGEDGQFYEEINQDFGYSK